MGRIAPELSSHLKQGGLVQIILQSILAPSNFSSPEWEFVKPSGYALLSKFLLWLRAAQISGLILIVFLFFRAQ